MSDDPFSITGKFRRLDAELQSKAELLRELRVHQTELEMQNRQLKDAQQEIEEARDRYANLYDYSPVGYLTLDEKGTVLEINLTGAGMLGAERLIILGKPFLSYLTAESTPIFIAHLGQTFSVAENSVSEIFLKTNDAKPRQISLESRIVAGGKRVCRTVMQDVTEQRKIAVALEVSRSAQNALLNAIPSLVFYLDVNLRYLNSSQVFADFVGLAPEKVMGKTVYDFFGREIADNLTAVFSSVLQNGSTLYGVEHCLPNKSGEVFDFSSVISPFRDLGGKIIGLVGVCVDITVIKDAMKLNLELLLQNRSLTRNLFLAQEEERRFLARELHDELGQWFTAIQTEAQVLSNIAKSTPEIHSSALAIRDSSNEVHKVIRGMMHKLRPNLLDELGLADSLRELQRQWCNNYPDISCRFDLKNSIADFGEDLNITIYRLLQEALNNIAKHAQAHHVIVSLDMKNSGNDAGILLLRVEDDGIGFDEKIASEGIGLLGMRERVIAVGGELSITSRPGNGTQLFVWLPLGKPDVNKYQWKK